MGFTMAYYGMISVWDSIVTDMFPFSNSNSNGYLRKKDSLQQLLIDNGNIVDEEAQEVIFLKKRIVAKVHCISALALFVWH